MGINSVIWLEAETRNSPVTAVTSSHESKQEQKAPSRSVTMHISIQAVTFLMYKRLKSGVWNGLFVRNKVLKRTVWQNIWWACPCETGNAVYDRRVHVRWRTRTLGPFNEMRLQRFTTLWVHVSLLNPPPLHDWIWLLFHVRESRAAGSLGKDMNKWSPWWNSPTSQAEHFATIIKGSFYKVIQHSVFVVPQSTWFCINMV